MSKKQLIWAAMFVLLGSISTVVAQIDNQQDPNRPAVDNSRPIHDQDKDKKDRDCDDNDDVVKTDIDLDNQSSSFRTGYDIGYKLGYDQGKSEYASGARFEPDGSATYKDSMASYEDTMGNKKMYRKGYRTGFKLGYEDGYTGKPSQFALATAVAVPVPQPLETESKLEITTTAPVTPPDTSVDQSSSTVTQSQDLSGQTMERDIEIDRSETHSRDLPRTASPLPLIGLLGLAAFPLSFLLRLIGNRMR